MGKSYFIIQKACTRCAMLFDGDPVVIGQKYDFLEQDKLVIENTSGIKAVPADSFTFTSEVDDVMSQNSSEVIVNFSPDYDMPIPNVAEDIEDVEINSEISLIGYIPASDSSDRIIIKEINGKGYFTVAGQQINAGDIIYYYDLSDITFISSDEGAEENYASIVFRYANDQAEADTDSSLTISTVSLAELVSDLTAKDVSADGKFKRRFTFSIEKQIVDKTFELTIDTAGISFTMTPINNLTINTETFELVIDSNGSTPLTETNYNDDGRLLFTGVITSDIDFTSSDEIIVTLDSIDLNPALVNPLKNSLTFNLE